MVLRRNDDAMEDDSDSSVEAMWTRHPDETRFDYYTDPWQGQPLSDDDFGKLPRPPSLYYAAVI